MVTLSADLSTFDADADDPYPEGELERAALDRLKSRRDLVARIINCRSSLRRRPFDPETGEIRSAFDEIWQCSTEAYSIHDGPETWTFHAERTYSYPDPDIKRWDDLPTLDLSWTDDWDRMRLPKIPTGGSVYSCTRCSFTTRRDDWARRHARENHQEVDRSRAELVGATNAFDIVPEGETTDAGEDLGQHALDDFAGGPA